MLCCRGIFKEDALWSLRAPRVADHSAEFKGSYFLSERLRTGEQTGREVKERER